MADISIQAIRTNYPQYQDMDDLSLAAAVRRKFYADMPFEEFAKRIGVKPAEYAPGATGMPGEGPSQAETDVNSGFKGDKRAGTRLNTKLGGKVLQGASLNFGDELIAGVTAPFDAAINAFRGEGPTDVGEAYAQGLALERDQLKAAEAAHPIAAPLAEIGGALLTAKAPLGVISKARNLGEAAIASGGTGAIMGGLSGFGAGEGSLENRLNDASKGFLAGGAVGLAAPVIGAAIGKAVSPFKTSAARMQLADMLRREGVDLTAGQRTGSNALRYAEGEIGGQRAADMIERQGEQFTAAALKRVGANANRATPDVINNAFHRIDQQFDGLAARNQLTPDQQMVNDLSAIRSQYSSFTPQSNRVSIVDDTINDIMQTIGLNGPNGTRAIAGDSYQALSSYLSRQARNATNPELAQALRGIKEAMDDAMERAIAQGNPRDLAAWRKARNLYHNLLVVEQAAAGAGENATLGLISPSRLRNASMLQGQRGYARGTDDFAELARAGEETMTQLPSFGNAGRTAIRALRLSIPTTIGTMAGKVGGPLGTWAGTAARRDASGDCGRPHDDKGWSSLSC